eukprot:c4310_g1_i2.p1 GENE.c4310_g1_i2~~c4310_g1_i2.p1  ORF type:complete len:271 (-),score=68.31 c4310_g1_i2:219-1031(-)
MSASAPDWTQQRDDTDLPVFFRVVNAILRFINVVFSAVFFPLYTSLQRLQTETKSEFPRGFWFGVRRFFAALFALSLLAGYVVMFVLVVEALAGPSTLARSVSAVSSVIAIAYGLAIIESSSMRRIFRCFSSPIRYGPLLVSILDALCDLVASAGCVVVCMCVLRVRYLVRALSQALTDENPRPYKYRFQYIVLCEVGMTCVDVVVCPFACALLLFPWRTAEAFRKIRAMQSQRHARAMVFIQLMRGLGDLPFIIMSTVVRMEISKNIRK